MEPAETGARALRADQLYRACDPASLGCETTTELEPLRDRLGQGDALAALEFGMAVASSGYNVFVLGQSGSGRSTFVRQAAAERASGQATPGDWCYVFNFKDPRRPRALSLPPGQGPELRDELRQLVAELKEALPRALGAEEATARRATVGETFGRRAAAETEAFEKTIADDEHVALLRKDDSLDVVPARGGEAIRPDAFDSLPKEQRETIEQHLRAAQLRLFSLRRKLHELHREAHGRVAELNREVARGEIDHRIEVLKEKFAGAEAVPGFLDELEADILQHGDAFASPAEEDPSTPFEAMAREEFFRRYEANPLVTRQPGSGAPVVEVSNPTLTNLLGAVERRIQFGVMVTDFTRIEAGALHRGNGGYVVLDAADLLSRPMVWPALKRVLRTRELRPSEAATEIGLFATESLEPEPIPTNLKVVLIGEPHVYYLLRTLDAEFAELFKVKSDFRPRMERDVGAERHFAAFIAARCTQESLPPFDAPAVSRVIEEASRLAADQHRLTTRFSEVDDLVREAAHWASGDGRAVVQATDVDRALDERRRRNGRPHREVLDLIARGVLAFQPRGEAIGQIHGIGLLSLGDVVFGRPIRLMASAFLGTGGVIQIEREVALSGPIHNKGFLVLSGYLGKRFAQTHPLILSASLSFDQLYEEVEGDSASAAELFALLSAIGAIPIRQGIAVTGAINQDGLVLPVGGVTEKVEGFFAACEHVGLDGSQGVILPRRNADNLVVRQDLRDAVAAGRFHVWTIDRVEQGWPILCGRQAGTPTDGVYPPETVHQAVASRLAEWAAKWRAFGQPGGSDPARP